MRILLRLLVLGCAGATSLALAGNAVAKTQLLVSGATDIGASAATTVEVKGATEDAASARVSIYVPSGYTANLSQAATTQIGTVSARAQLLEINADAVLDVTGTILVADRNDPSLGSGAMQCTGTPTHAAIWLLRLSSRARPSTSPSTSIRRRAPKRPSAAQNSCSASRSRTQRLAPPIRRSVRRSSMQT